MKTALALLAIFIYLLFMGLPSLCMTPRVMTKLGEPVDSMQNLMIQAYCISPAAAKAQDAVSRYGVSPEQALLLTKPCALTQIQKDADVPAAVPIVPVSDQRRDSDSSIHLQEVKLEEETKRVQATEYTKVHIAWTGVLSAAIAAGITLAFHFSKCNQ